MEVATYTAHLRSSGRRLADAASAAGLDAVVPSCPDWRVRDLVHHTAGVHRWATSFLLDPTRRPGDDDGAFFAPTADDALLDAYRTAHGALVAALHGAPADVPCWSFLAAPTPLAFWARRQAHETTVHAADAELAGGIAPDVDASLAADGIDELLNGFLSRPRGRLVADPAVRLAVEALDAPAAFTISIGPDGRVVTPGVSAADCAVHGPAGAVYLLLWNRVGPEWPGLTLRGDRRVLELWRERGTVVWS